MLKLTRTHKVGNSCRYLSLIAEEVSHVPHTASITTENSVVFLSSVRIFLVRVPLIPMITCKQSINKLEDLFAFQSPGKTSFAFI